MTRPETRTGLHCNGQKMVKKYLAIIQSYLEWPVCAIFTKYLDFWHHFGHSFTTLQLTSDLSLFKDSRKPPKTSCDRHSRMVPTDTIDSHQFSVWWLFWVLCIIGQRTSSICHSHDIILLSSSIAFEFHCDLKGPPINHSWPHSPDD